jgi:hypothetical protein
MTKTGNKKGALLDAFNKRKKVELHNTLREHGIGDFQEARDVCAFNMIASAVRGNRM